MQPESKTTYQIERMRAAGRIAALALARAACLLRPGLTTRALAAEVESQIVAAGARSSLRLYRGFAAGVAICVNEEALHGTPNDRPLEEGDLVTVDVALNLAGYHADSAWTWAVGPASEPDARLLAAGEAALWAGIGTARAGAPLQDIGASIAAVAEAAGVRVLAGYGGHGIGRRLHERPFVPNRAQPGSSTLLVSGMTLTVEPILCAGEPHARAGRDRWTVITADGAHAVSFEHTIAITEGAPIVLTAL